jgi:hypothetical protein
MAQAPSVSHIMDIRPLDYREVMLEGGAILGYIDVADDGSAGFELRGPGEAPQWHRIFDTVEDAESFVRRNEVKLTFARECWSEDLREGLVKVLNDLK